MTLTEAMRAALKQGCELEPVAGSARYTIRAIAYDADPYEISEVQLMDLDEAEFLREWIPQRL